MKLVRIKLKLTSLIFMIWILMMILDSRFFGIIEIPDSLFIYMGSTSRFFVGILGIGAAFLTIAYCRGFLNITKFIKKYTIIYLIVIVSTVFYTVIAFPNQYLKVSIRYSFQYLIILFTIPLLYYSKKRGIDKIFASLNVFCLFSNILILIQALIYNSGGNIFLKNIINYLATGTPDIRNGRIRIGLYAMFSTSILYNYYIIFFTKEKFRNKMLSAFELAIGLIDVFYVQQTRMTIIMLLISLILPLLFHVKKMLGRVIILLTISAVILMSTGIIENIRMSFFTAELAKSTVGRMIGYQYYWSYFLKHPIWGFGFARDGAYPTIVHGPRGLAYTSDCGFIGQLGTLGIFSIFLELPLIIRGMKILIKTNDIFLEMLFIYLIGTNISMSSFEAPLMLNLVVNIVIFENIFYKYQRTLENYSRIDEDIIDTLTNNIDKNGSPIRSTLTIN